ncbi:MAG: hypothetical protein U0228_02620 [Myxococcaceae bacterium]
MSAPRWQHVTSRDSSYDELVPLAQHLGVAVKRPLAFTVRDPASNLEIAVALEINSGSVTGVTFTTRVAAPLTSHPFLIARRETALDKADKNSGLVHEVQLGDAAFDAAVFLDSNAPDEEVHRFLAAPSSHRVIESMLHAGADRVTWKDGLLVASLGRAKSGSLDSMVRVFEGVALLSKSGPVPRGPAKERRGGWLTWVIGLGLPASIGAFVLAVEAFSVGEKLWLLLPAMAVLGFSGRPFIRAAVSGDSGSGGRSRVLLFLYVLESMFGGSAVVMMANAIPDRAPIIEREGTVVGGSGPDDDGHYSIEIRWDDGSTSSHGFDGPVSAGNPMLSRVHPGLFWRWGERVSMK